MDYIRWYKWAREKKCWYTSKEILWTSSIEILTTSSEILVGVGAGSLVATRGLADVQAELVLLVAAHVRVRHEVQRVAANTNVRIKQIPRD